MQLRTTLGFFVLAVASAVAQNPAPPAPTPQAPAPQAPAPQAPAAAPAAFPPVDPANFTATTPTKETVEDFLHAFWGYDNSRVWQIQAILPTPAPGVSRVLILVKGNGHKEQTA